MTKEKSPRREVTALRVLKLIRIFHEVSNDFVFLKYGCAVYLRQKKMRNNLRKRPTGV